MFNIYGPLASLGVRYEEIICFDQFRFVWPAFVCLREETYIFGLVPFEVFLQIKLMSSSDMKADKHNQVA